jgi:transcriptional regulator with XRE-family HTH domain
VRVYVFTRPDGSAILAPVTSTGKTSIGRNIKRLRIEKGFQTQGEFAKALDVPQPRLADWENDRYKAPDLASLLRMAKVLGYSVDVLLAGVDKEYDLVSQKTDLLCHPVQVHSALSTRDRTKSSAESSDATRYFQSILKELSEAAGVFKELSILSTEWSTRASEWGARLTELQVQSAEALAGGQAAMGGRPSSGVSAGRGGRARPADRQRRGHRKTA